MSPFRLIRICLAALAALLAASASARVSEKWLWLASEHFDMLSCSPEPGSREMLVRLEQFRAAFFKLFPMGRAHDPRPLIIVFDSEKQFAPYKPKPQGRKSVDMAGFFVAGVLNSRIAMVNHDIDQGFSIIFHEYVHSLVAARDWKLPLWVNEGLAELYSSLDIRKDTVTLMKPHPWHVHALRTEKLIPLRALFSADHGSPLYNEKNKAGMFYAQSWALMHYLVCGEKSDAATSRNFGRFLALCERPDVPIPAAFEQAFGMQYKDLERNLGEYVRSGKYRGGDVTIPAKPIRDKITCRPATEFERDMELLELRWRVHQSGDTTYRLLQMAEKFPGAPRIHELLAEISMRENEMPMAADYLRKAVDRNSQNPFVYVWLLRDYFEKTYAPLDYKMPAEICAEYRVLVDRALELAPDCMEAYELLAMTEAQCEKMRATALKRVLEARPNMRDDQRTLVALAVVYWRIKDYVSAGRVLDELGRRKNPIPAVTQRAEALRKQIAIEKGEIPPPPEPEIVTIRRVRASGTGNPADDGARKIMVPPPRMPPVDVSSMQAPAGKP